MSDGYAWLTARGMTDYYVDHVFGANTDVGTSFEPVSAGGIYRTPQVADAKQLRIKAGNAADDIAGVGARKILLLGMKTDLTTFFEVVETAGASASALTTNSFFRLLRAEVLESGTYTDASSFSHVGDIVIEDNGGIQWGCINSSIIARGIAQIGSATVPSSLSNGTELKELYITGYVMTVDGNKNADMILSHRAEATQTVAPYSGFHITREHLQVSGVQAVQLSVPIGPFMPGTDFGFLARADTTASCSIDIEAVLVRA